MNTIRNTVLSAVAATSTMTLFSYFVSDQEGKNFKEPKLLGDFFKRTFNSNEKTSTLMGWTIHYLTGVGFAGVYQIFLGCGFKRPTVKNGLLYGAVAGGIGVLIWNTLFKNHPNPPKTHRKGYYLQLVVAHLIFGVTLSALKKRHSDIRRTYSSAG